MAAPGKSQPSTPGPSASAPSGLLRALPSGVWALGFVSLFMDISSELIHSLLPVFMSSVLGASMMTIGMVEGMAEATASVTKVFSGTVSDALRKRKLLAVLGYGLAAGTKPIFPLAGTMGWVFAARFLDRVGKGIRGAPRDALVADLTPRNLWGAAYGFRQSLDSVGAFLGPVFAVAFMAWFSNDIRLVFWVAVFPAFVSVALLMLGVHEPEQGEISPSLKSRFTLAALKQLSLRYWLIVLLSAAFTMARFSEAFLILRARDVGLAIGYVPLIMIVMNIVYAVSAYPAGIASDRVSSRTLLVIGLAMLIAADLILAAAASPLTAFVGAGFWGLHMGITQGLFAKLVADVAPADLRGTAFGLFNLVGGGALLLASVLAGALWNSLGAPATFLAGAAFSALAACGLISYRKKPSTVKPGGN
ncbi:Predicted arabinose efflux permease, MFS family [Syntrophus gentianae]|uniref:Predicted arabinose efflux permease, MFS family n=1 Tax=Syntrophus gentianae TaxID=43775 RepID=A0A1H8AIK0_9BACT|nr:MFS transporter [Syntrophus gentianae]SEM70363.1 Predicted arabinose efflux permease, MFS family [Syntrophus gentianae]